METSTGAMTMSVREGLFFRTPAVLPRGRHRLPRDQVLVAQRERLMAAITALMAERGYERVRVGDVAELAGVSRTAFYDCFPDKQACVFAAYDRFIEVLLRRVSDASDPTRDVEDYLAALLESYFGTIEDDPVVARACQLEMDALGAVARRRRRDALLPFAQVVREHHQMLSMRDATLEVLPSEAYVAIVYGLRQLGSDMLDAEPEPDLRSLISPMTQWILAAFRGTRASTAAGNPPKLRSS